MSFLSQERLYLKPFSLSFVKEANGLLVTEKQLCYLTAWNGTERLQRLPTVKKFTLTSWGEGWTLPVESEVSGRTCAICRFAKPKGVQKSAVTLTPTLCRTSFIISRRYYKRRWWKQRTRWWLLLVYSDKPVCRVLCMGRMTHQAFHDSGPRIHKCSKISNQALDTHRVVRHFPMEAING